MKYGARAFLIITLLAGATAFGQTTEFTYQGRISDNGSPANGLYDIRFRLFATSTPAGIPLGNNERTNVAVVDGVFTVTLDFGPNAFNGNDRYLEIGIRPAGGTTYTVLSPLPKITSVPYALRSQNAATASDASQLGGVAANQYVQTTDPRLSDDRNPTPNSPNYIRNSQTQQTNSNFSISGTGSIGGAANVGGNLNVNGNGLFLGDVTVLGALNTNGGDASYVQNRTTLQPGTTNFNINGNGILGGNLRAANVNATSAFQLNSTRVFHATGAGNLFAGYGAGDNNTASNNTFLGTFSGVANTSGTDNTFIGFRAGNLNTTGADNVFVGQDSGLSNTSGRDNSFFGRNAGRANTNGTGNSFFGSDAGLVNSGGSFNSFFGYQAGAQNTSSSNAFFGSGAGAVNNGIGNAFFGANAGRDSTGNYNAYFGHNAGINSGAGEFNAFFGQAAGRANSSGSNNVFIGAVAGEDNTTGSMNTFIGFTAGESNLSGTSNTAIGGRAGANSTTGGENTYLGVSAGSQATGSRNVFLGADSGLNVSSGDNNIFIGYASGNFSTGNNNIVIGERARMIGSSESIAIGKFAATGFPQTDGCDSCIAIGHDAKAEGTFMSVAIGPFARAMRDFEFVLGDYRNTVIIPGNLTVEGTITNLSGISRSLIEEQSREIESLREQVRAQRAELAALKALVCAANPGAAACKEEK
ncbi:MAG: hypothetical protein KF762_05800 [Acidobacteria bacterium]|nr:hypothetical protein [Acidobacteriota bacterium]